MIKTVWKILIARLYDRRKAHALKTKAPAILPRDVFDGAEMTLGDDVYSMAPFPHCDSNVLHAPGTCEHCDHYPLAQQERIARGINFTGEDNPKKEIDPATSRRPLHVINLWPGNRPEPKGKR